MPAGWGEVDDDESIRAIRRALELGVTLFDTADVYGCGHSERVLGRALGGRRDDAVIVTKVGNVFDERTRTAGGKDLSPGYVRQACEASLRRLGTDRIDVYLIHDGLAGPHDVPAVLDVLEELVAAGRCARTARACPIPRSCGRWPPGRTWSPCSTSSTCCAASSRRWTSRRTSGWRASTARRWRWAS